MRINKIKDISIIFFDIDGTLLDHATKKVSDKTLETLKRLKEKGIKLCIASGRSPITLPVFEDNLFDAYLTFNGSYCYADDDIIFSNPIDNTDVQKLIHNADSLGRPVSIATRNRVGANGSDDELLQYYAFADIELVVAEDFDDLRNEEVFQVMMGCNLLDHASILEGVSGAKIVYWWEHAVDIIPSDGGKGVGIQKILEHFGYDRSEAMAFGDGNNDIDMFNAVDFGIAMGNGSVQLKEIAYDVCDSVTNDGIYHYCIKHGLV